VDWAALCDQVPPPRASKKNMIAFKLSLGILSTLLTTKDAPYAHIYQWLVKLATIHEARRVIAQGHSKVRRRSAPASSP